MTRRKAKHPGGRPVTTGRGSAGRRVNVCVSETEYQALTLATTRAEAASVAAWVRDVALRAAK
jgi:hypothetical protein